MTDAGIFDGFEYYVTPTTQDYERVLKSGIVVLDTNTLLNLYRYTADARDDLLNVLAHLGDSLWIPNQVLVEFWRNRESVLRDGPRERNRTISELEMLRTQSLTSIRSWANRVSLPNAKRDSVLDALQKAFAQGIDEISKEGAGTDLSSDTFKDPVLLALGPLLKGHIGEPLSPEARALADVEGLRRIAGQVPPGYRDKGVGDYLVWEQTLLKASTGDSDVLFVTGDVKEDWWRQEAGEKRGPRRELFEELASRAGVRLLMMRPATLLEIAPSILDVVVRSESLLLVRRVDDGAIRRGETRKLIIEGNYEEAAVNFSRMIESTPQNESAYIGRAQAYYGLGRLAEALEDLATAEELNPSREETRTIRDAMLAGEWSPRSAALAREAVADFELLVKSGDAAGAANAQNEAETSGLTNPAYICINRTIIDLLRGDPSAAAETFTTRQPASVGPYVRVTLEILRLLTMTQKGEAAPHGKFDEYRGLQPDYDYRLGPLMWLKEGLTVTGQVTEETERLFARFEMPLPAAVSRRRLITRGGVSLRQESE